MLLCHKQVGHRLKGQHGAAIAGRCRVGGKEPEQRPPQADADRHHPKRIHQQDPPPFPQALFHTARLKGGCVLRNKEHCGLHKAKHRHHQQAGQLACAGEACNGFHTQAAQQPLFDRGDDGAAGLLDTVGGRQPEDIPGIARLEHPGREGRVHLGAAQKRHHVDRARHLRRRCGSRRTGHPEGPHQNKVKHNVHHAGRHNDLERRFGIAAAHDTLLAQIIGHQKWQPQQIDAPVEHSGIQDLRRRVDQPQQGRQGHKAHCRGQQGDDLIHEQQVVQQLCHLMFCGSGLARRHQQAAAQLHAAGDEQKDHQHRGSVGHCRQRIGIQPQADDHGIGHGVKLCCHHAQDNGQRVPQQRGPHCPGQQRILFVHTNTLFSQKNKTRREPDTQAPCGFFFSCASRSRTYDGGVKVPCLTAWRWRTGKNQYSRISFICQAKAFCRVCAKCFATLLPCLYSVLVIMRSACPFSALFSQKVLTPPS